MVCQTSLRIDGYLLSRTARTCIGLELTCPMEENITKWHGSKLRKYEEEISFQATKNGWKFYAVVIEVGARGWIPPSVHSGLSRLGIPRHLVSPYANNLRFSRSSQVTSFGLTVSIRTFNLGDSLLINTMSVRQSLTVCRFAPSGMANLSGYMGWPALSV